MLWLVRVFLVFIIFSFPILSAMQMQKILYVKLLNSIFSCFYFDIGDNLWLDFMYFQESVSYMAAYCNVNEGIIWYVMLICRIWWALVSTLAHFSKERPEPPWSLGGLAGSGIWSCHRRIVGWEKTTNEGHSCSRGFNLK